LLLFFGEGLDVETQKQLDETACLECIDFTLKKEAQNSSETLALLPNILNDVTAQNLES
jgi:hypothetical protein